MNCKKSKHTLFVALIILLASLNCSNPNKENLNINTIARNYPRVDGSTSTHPLSVLLACKIFGLSYEWKTPPASEKTVFPSFRQNAFTAKFIEDTVRHHGTHEAYMNLAKKKVELVLVARAPSDREIGAARKLGIAFDVKPIALDALVFVVNKKNTINSLTLSQIRSIYSHDSPPRWSDVGGSGSVIEAFQREQDSGSQEIFHKLVMRNTPIRGSNQIPVVYTMAGAVHAAALHENGIAFSVYYYITNMAENRSVKLIAVNGVHPSSKTIAASAYPLTSEVFAVIRMGMKKDSPAQMLRDWLETNEGKNVVQESGYVPFRRK